MPIRWYCCEKHDPQLVFSHIDRVCEGTAYMTYPDPQCPKCDNKKVILVKLL